MKVTVKATYQIFADTDSTSIDSEIRSEMKRLGAKEYASGLEVGKGFRDLVFDLEIKVPITTSQLKA